MNILLALEKIGVIFLLVLTGYVFAKIAKPTAQVRSTLSAIVLNIAVPASILAGVETTDFGEIQGDLVPLMAISAAIALVTLALSFPVGKLLEPKNRPNRCVLQAALYFHNYGFMGWPVCYMLLGEKGLLYAVLFSMPLHLLIYGLAPVLLSRADRNKRLFDKSMLINIPFYATVVTLTLMIAHVKLPGVLASLMDMLGELQTPLAMMVIGMILATARLKDMMSGFKVYGYSLVRLGVFPVLAFLALKAFGFSGLLLGVPVMITAMPAGAMNVVLTERSGLDAVYASRLVIVSTLISILTIPLVSLLII